MTLNHSKTWPVSTLAVVQLRVDPNGRTYSTQFDGDEDLIVTDFELPREAILDDCLQTDAEIGEQTVETIRKRLANGTSGIDNKEIIRAESNAGNLRPSSNGNNGNVVLSLSQQHVELFTVQQQAQRRHPYKTTVRTDTVSTILEQEQDQDHNDATIPSLDEGEKRTCEKFHVLALTKIDELNEIERVKTPTVRVENWDVIYNDNEHEVARAGVNGGPRKLCPACIAAAAAAATTYKKHSPSDYNDRLLVDLPLDARKATTLRRHYYPEGGWGWVIITCTVLVHVLNLGLQLSCSQLAPAGAEKFKTTPVHIAGQ